MINIEMARDYLHRAGRCMAEAENALADSDAPMAIRRAQEALGLSAKALLRAMAIEYPRAHDVSDALLANADALPEELRANVGELASLVSELAAIRGPAFYGYEREGIPASKAFSLDYARDICAKVKAYVGLMKSALEPFLKSSLERA